MFQEPIIVHAILCFHESATIHPSMESGLRIRQCLRVIHGEYVKSFPFPSRISMFLSTASALQIAEVATATWILHPIQ